MSKNCLFQKLKGTVDNDNLPVFGEVTVKLSKNTSTSPARHICRIYGEDDFNVNILNGGYFTDGSLTQNDGTTKVVNGNFYYMTPDNDCQMKFKSVYNLTELVHNYGDVVFDVLDFQYSKIKKLKGTQTEDKYFELENLEKFNYLENFNVSGGKIRGNISDFAKCPTLKEINTTSGSVSGSIVSLASLIHLESISFGNYANVTGEINDLASAMVASPNSRTSGTLTVMKNGKITLNGTVITANKVITFDSSLPNGYSIADE